MPRRQRAPKTVILQAPLAHREPGSPFVPQGAEPIPDHARPARSPEVPACAGTRECDLIEKIGGGSVFTRELRVRFLDHLAFQGNARGAALHVNVSHETAYRARRQDAAFAALWDAALVHTRSYGEQVLASRALDGVEQAVVRNGEIVGDREPEGPPDSDPEQADPADLPYEIKSAPSAGAKPRNRVTSVSPRAAGTWAQPSRIVGGSSGWKAESVPSVGKTGPARECRS